MSFERDVNLAVQVMFKHAKGTISKNIRAAIKTGKLTLDEAKVPGLELLINRSLDEAYVQAGRQLQDTLKNKK